jgi:molybdate transport system ATP-binding protein
VSGADERAGTVLILDEPFDGLDVAVPPHSWPELLGSSCTRQGYTLVLVLNRFDEIPEFIQNAGVLADCTPD